MTGDTPSAIGAAPPVRLREVVESVSGEGNLHSVCGGAYDPALAAFAAGILERLPEL